MVSDFVTRSHLFPLTKTTKAKMNLQAEIKNQLKFLNSLNKKEKLKLLKENNFKTTKSDIKKLAEKFAERRLWIQLTKPNFLKSL